MIPAKVDESGRVDLRPGQIATLVLPGPYHALGSKPVFRDAHYLGFVPPSNKFHGFWSDGWGHLFASLNPGGEVSLHISQSLGMEYLNDGEGDPCYALGISASDTRVIVLNQLEAKFLRGRLGDKK